MENTKTPYEQVEVKRVDRVNRYIVAGQQYSSKEFSTIFLKLPDWKKFMQSISVYQTPADRCRYASDRLWLARRGYTDISNVYRHKGQYVCANEVLEATGQCRNWVYRRCEMWEAGELSWERLFAPRKIEEDGRKRENWGNLTGLDRPATDDFQVGTWEAENFDKVSLDGEERCVF